MDVLREEVPPETRRNVVFNGGEVPYFDAIISPTSSEAMQTQLLDS